MAWIESHQEIWRHPKTKKLARLLAVSVPTAVGHLHGLWYWALDFAQDGALGQYDPEELADAAMWEGDPRQFVEALVAAGYLDKAGESGALTLHDWYDYAGRLMEQREAKKEQNRLRKQRQRERQKAEACDNHAGVTAMSRGTDGSVTPLPYLTQPDPTQSDLTRQNGLPLPPSDERGEPAKKPTIDDRFAEFWAAYPKKVGKQYALKAWRRIKPDVELHGRIMQAVSEQKRSSQWRSDNGRYIPNPATWLNGGYWDNESGDTGADTDRRQVPEWPAPGAVSWTGGFKPADDDDGE